MEWTEASLRLRRSHSASAASFASSSLAMRAKGTESMAFHSSVNEAEFMLAEVLGLTASAYNDGVFDDMAQGGDPAATIDWENDEDSDHGNNAEVEGGAGAGGIALRDIDGPIWCCYISAGLLAVLCGGPCGDLSDVCLDLLQLTAKHP